MTTETDEAIVAAARALVPFLVEGWDEYDDPEDQAKADAACNALIGAVRAAPPPAPAERERAEPWADKSDEWSDAIKTAHPIVSGAHKEYETALQMVGNRHSKAALVELVCWLLQRAAPAAPSQDALDAKLINVVLDNLPYLENLILPAGHESGLMREHPSPCVGHDFCLIKQAQHGADTIRAAIDAALRGKEEDHG